MMIDDNKQCVYFVWVQVCVMCVCVHVEVFCDTMMILSPRTGFDSLQSKTEIYVKD